eukprot:Em0005g690a
MPKWSHTRNILQRSIPIVVSHDPPAQMAKIDFGMIEPLHHSITLQVIGCGKAFLHPRSIRCALNNAAFKVPTLVQVNDFCDNVCAEQLDKFSCDPYGCLV